MPNDDIYNCVNLHEAAECYCVETARAFIEAGSNINKVDNNGMTPLLLAAHYDYHQEGNDFDGMIELLVTKGADVNATSSDGWTPLHFVVNYFPYDHVRKSMKILIDHGADVTLRNQDGDMPIHLLFNFGQIENVKLLAQFHEDKDIDIFISSMIGRTHLITKILDNNPAMIKVTDDYSSTPLMTAAQNNQIESVQLLLGRGANPNAKNQGGITALQITQDKEIAAYLLSKGATPDPLPDNKEIAEHILSILPTPKIPDSYGAWPTPPSS